MNNTITLSLDTDKYLISHFYDVKDYISVVAIATTCNALRRVCDNCIDENGTKKSLKERLLAAECEMLRCATKIWFSLQPKIVPPLYQEGDLLEDDDLYESPTIQNRQELLQLADRLQFKDKILSVLNFLETFMKRQYNRLNEKSIEILKENIIILFTSNEMLTVILNFIVNNKLDVCKTIVEVAKNAYNFSDFNDAESENSKNNPIQRKILGEICHVNLSEGN